MRKLIKNGIAAASALAVLCSSVFAASPTVVYDYSNNRVTVSGNSDSGVVLQILKKGKSIADLMNVASDGDIILYSRQFNDDMLDNGKYSFSVRYADITDDTFEQGNYNAYLVDGTGEITPFVLELFTKMGYSTVVNKLNEHANSGDYDTFVKTVEENLSVLNLNENLYNMMSAENDLKPCFEYIADNNLNVEKSVENKQIISRFMIMQAARENKLDNIDEYIADTIDINSDVYKDYVEYTADAQGKESSQKQKYLTEKMIAETPANYEYEDFETVLEQGIVLTAIKYASGYADVKNALQSYGKSVGISGSAPDSVYRKLSGGDYTADSLLTAYEELNDDSSSNSGTASRPSGGSSGGGGGGYSGGAASQYKIEEAETEIQRELNMYFEDIDGVDWAVEAILALADKGIINGKSEGKFKPDDFVTREEFAKILVGAMGMANAGYRGNVFADVNDDDWFCPYVNIAYEQNIVKGIGEGLFGTGEMISRQDMAVMICNALVSKGNTLPSGELAFEDGNQIADYAKEAVAALYSMGVVNGISETHFDPLGNATRAQAAKIVYGVLKQLQ